jgi:hypothetical protein
MPRGRAARRRRLVRGWQPSRHHSSPQKMFLSRLGTGVFRPDRRSRPCSRARRAAAVPVAGPDATAASASWRGARNPHLQQTRDEARLNPTCHARPSLLARRGHLVPRARRATTRGRSRSCTKEHGSTAKPTTFPSTATARARRARPPAWGSRGATPPLITYPTRARIALRAATAELRGTTGLGAPSAAARQSCGAKASTQARNP